MKKFSVICYVFLVQAFTYSQIDSLRKQISTIVSPMKADIGVAISGMNNEDTLSFNGSKMYPMMSVVKFHTALAVLDLIDKKKLSMKEKIFVKKENLDSNTHSPMRDEKPKGGFETTVSELLKYSISNSDNIAFLILVDLLGDIRVVNDFVGKCGVRNIYITSTYRDSFEAVLNNRSSPVAANQLLKKFYPGEILQKASSEYLLKIMTENNTGLDRIKWLLPKGAVVSHKTGTAGKGKDGVNMAFNDIGVVRLPNGKYFYISVFITDSRESDETNAQIIAEISKAAWDYFERK